MKGAEFIQRVQRYAKAHELACNVDQKRGKGSHVTLYLG
jgi:mRNA interferase HicA